MNSMCINKIKTLSKQQIDAVNNYIKAVKSKPLLNVEKVILFGSYAKNSANKWSDIDLAVISDKFDENRYDYQVELSKLTLGISNDLEPHPLSNADLDNPYHPLAKEVMDHGIVIEQTNS